MKTEQEQIEEIEKVLKDSVADYKHLKKKGVCYCYAETLIDCGYGDVSEYKAEIERLRQEVRDTDKMARNTIEQYKNNYDNAFERLKEQQREIERLKAKVKQAKIDVLNKAKERAVGLAAIETYHICNLINELIKEVENEQKD